MSSSMLVGALSGEGKTRHKGESTDMTKSRSPIGIRHDHETSVFRDGLFWTVAKTGVENELHTEYGVQYGVYSRPLGAMNPQSLHRSGEGKKKLTHAQWRSAWAQGFFWMSSRRLPGRDPLGGASTSHRGILNGKSFRMQSRESAQLIRENSRHGEATTLFVLAALGRRV